MTPTERVKAWRQANPGRRNSAQREKYNNDPAYRKEYLAKQRAHYHKDADESRRKNREKRARLREIKPDPPEKPGLRRERHLKKRYGLTSEQKALMLEAQGGTCAICATDKPTGRWGWHVDHSHTTGKVRGILCSNCNLAIGLLCDDPEKVKSAEQYLRKYHDPNHSSATPQEDSGSG